MVSCVWPFVVGSCSISLQWYVVTIVVPSYLAKIDRAQQHLQDLDVEVANYVNSKPYRVGTQYEGKRQGNVRRVHPRPVPEAHKRYVPNLLGRRLGEPRPRGDQRAMQSQRKVGYLRARLSSRRAHSPQAPAT